MPITIQSRLLTVPQQALAQPIWLPLAPATTSIRLGPGLSHCGAPLCLDRFLPLLSQLGQLLPSLPPPNPGRLSLALDIPSSRKKPSTMLSSPVALLLVHHSSDLLLYGLPQQWNGLPELEKPVLPTAASPAPAGTQ